MGSIAALDDEETGIVGMAQSGDGSPDQTGIFGSIRTPDDEETGIVGVLGYVRVTPSKNIRASYVSVSKLNTRITQAYGLTPAPFTYLEGAGVDQSRSLQL